MFCQDAQELCNLYQYMAYQGAKNRFDDASASSRVTAALQK